MNADDDSKQLEEHRSLYTFYNHISWHFHINTILLLRTFSCVAALELSRELVTSAVHSSDTLQFGRKKGTFYYLSLHVASECRPSNSFYFFRETWEQNPFSRRRSSSSTRENCSSSAGVGRNPPLVVCLFFVPSKHVSFDEDIILCGKGNVQCWKILHKSIAHSSITSSV